MGDGTSKASGRNIVHVARYDGGAASARKTGGTRTFTLREEHQRFRVPGGGNGSDLCVCCRRGVTTDQRDAPRLPPGHPHQKTYSHKKKQNLEGDRH